jgi:hypothetical protein
VSALDSLVVPEDGAPATGLELEVLAGAAAQGWSYSLEELRANRRRALSGLEALERSRQERAGGLPVPSALSGSADLSRPRRGLVEFERVLLVDLQDDAEFGWRPAVDEVTGISFSGLLFFVRFDRVFEWVAGAEPAGASDLNGLLRVSFDRAHGLRFWPDEGLDCGWEVSGWLVCEADPSEPLVSYPRPVERSVFEGLLERHWDLFMEEGCLQSTAYRLFPLDAAGGGCPSLEVGGGGRSA